MHGKGPGASALSALRLSALRLATDNQICRRASTDHRCDTCREPACCCLAHISVACLYGYCFHSLFAHADVRLQRKLCVFRESLRNEPVPEQASNLEYAKLSAKARADQLAKLCSETYQTCRQDFLLARVAADLTRLDKNQIDSQVIPLKGGSTVG